MSRPIRRAGFAALLLLVAGCRAEVGLSPERWAADYERFMESQLVDRTEAGMATGENGAVTVAYNGLAARAGLEALKQGGNAVDAAMTTALMQVAMNAEWNTVLGEDDPASIPGGLSLASPDGMYGTAVSGRTALVGGFMKGVGAAHERFGRLPREEIFAPAIHVAEQGFPISRKMEGYWSGRAADLARLPETKATFLKEDGAPYAEGDVLRQPALAATLRAVAERGTGYMYGGLMTVEDLAAYDVIWDEPLVADLGDGWRLQTNPPPNRGGVVMIEAQRLAAASGLLDEGHWAESPAALRTALDVTRASLLDFVPPEMAAGLVGGPFTPAARVTPEHAQRLWKVIEAGLSFGNWAAPGPGHSEEARFGGEGLWVAIYRDPETGQLRAASHNRNNSAAVAY